MFNEKIQEIKKKHLDIQAFVELVKEENIIKDVAYFDRKTTVDLPKLEMNSSLTVVNDKNKQSNKPILSKNKSVASKKISDLRKKSIMLSKKGSKMYKKSSLSNSSSKDTTPKMVQKEILKEDPNVFEIKEENGEVTLRNL